MVRLSLAISERAVGVGVAVNRVGEQAARKAINRMLIMNDWTNRVGELTCILFCRSQLCKPQPQMWIILKIDNIVYLTSLRTIALISISLPLSFFGFFQNPQTVSWLHSKRHLILLFYIAQTYPRINEVTVSQGFGFIADAFAFGGDDQLLTGSFQF